MHQNDTAIRAKHASGELVIDPPPEDIQFQPASLDLRLGNEFFVFHRPLGRPEVIQPIDPEEGFPEKWGERIVADEFVLVDDFILATTLETVRVPADWVARVEGRSSLGRLGLIVHATAGFVDPGFEGQITLEMFNLNPRPIRLRAGMRICQLAFETMSGPPARPYGHPELRSKYQGQRGVTPSRLHLEVRTRVPA